MEALIIFLTGCLAALLLRHRVAAYYIAPGIRAVMIAIAAIWALIGLSRQKSRRIGASSTALFQQTRPVYGTPAIRWASDHGLPIERALRFMN
jgi:hypothetical protein